MFSHLEFRVSIGLKFLRDFKCKKIRDENSDFMSKYFKEFYTIKYLEFLINFIGQSPATLNCSARKKGSQKLKSRESKVKTLKSMKRKNKDFCPPKGKGSEL